MRWETDRPTEMMGIDVQATEEATRVAMVVVDIIKGKEEDIMLEGINTRLEVAEEVTRVKEVTRV